MFIIQHRIKSSIKYHSYFNVSFYCNKNLRNIASHFSNCFPRCFAAIGLAQFMPEEHSMWRSMM